MSIVAEITEITPADAEKLLASNHHNRKISDRFIIDLAGRITRGEWSFNGEAIKVAEDGTLLDGQHRLAAVVRAQQPITTMLVTGLPTETQDTMDLGRRRSSADILTLRGYADCNVLAAAAQLCWGYLNNRMNIRTAADRKGSPQQIVEFVDKNHYYLDKAAKKGRALRQEIPVTASTATAAYFLLHLVDSEAVDDFWIHLITGVNLTAGSPILVLRNRLVRESIAPRKLIGYQILPLFLKAWNSWREDAPVSLLMWRDNEKYPVAA